MHPAQDVRGAELSGDQPVRGVQGARGGPHLRVQCRQRWPLSQECVGGSCSKLVFVVITVAEVGTGHNKEPIRNLSVCRKGCRVGPALRLENLVSLLYICHM